MISHSKSPSCDKQIMFQKKRFITILADEIFSWKALQVGLP